MKNTLIKVLSFMMALTMIVGCFSAITISAEDHVHTKGEKGETVAPTCKSAGYTWYTCAGCGEQYPDDIVARSDDHTGIVEIPASDATCTSPALTAGKKCEDCGTVVVEQQVVAGTKALKHKFAKTVYERVAPTCTEDGYTYYPCLNCGVYADDCAKEDAEGKFFAGAEGESYATYEKVVLANPYTYTHDWEYAETKAPGTCVDGEATQTCKRCKVVETFVILAKHNYVAVGDKTQDEEKTCTPVLKGEVCTLCNAINTEKEYELNENAEHNYGKNVDASEYNDKLLAMGYATPAALYKAATCAADGYQVQQCTVCKAYTQTAIKSTGHKKTFAYSEVVDGKEPATEYCSVSQTRVYKCAYGCGTVVDEVVIKKAVAHDMKAEVTKPTCDTQGFTTTTCQNANCTYSVVSNYVASTGHKYGTPYWSDANGVKVEKNNCANGIYKAAECTVEGCTEVKVDTIHAATTHVSSLIYDASTGNYAGNYKTIAATCVSATYGVGYCTNPDCDYVFDGASDPKYGYNANPDEAKDLDKTNHVNATIKAGVSKILNETCTTAGKAYFVCDDCRVTFVKVIPATGHTDYLDANNNGKYDEGEAYNQYWKSTDGETTVDKKDKATNCKDTGREGGRVCITCGTVTKEPTTVKYDPEKHPHKAEAVKVSDVKPTCVADGYEIWFRTCCGEFKEYTDALAKENDSHETKDYDAVKPTCGKAGNHAYTICTVCETVLSVTGTGCQANCGEAVHDDITHTLDYVIPALAHELEDVEEDTPVDCDDTGVTAHKACKNCDYTEGRRVIPAHGDKYKFVVEEEDAKAPNCTDAGIKAGEWCSVCDKDEYTLDPIGHDFTNFVKTFNASTDAKHLCTVAQFDIYSCKNEGCTAYRSTNYIPGKEAHSMALKWTEHKGQTEVGPRDTSKFTHYACQDVDYKVRECLTCTYSENDKDESAKPTINHYFVDGGKKVEILADCKNIADFEGESCVLCGATVDPDGIADRGSIIAAAHDVKKVEKEATCTTDGYLMEICSVCNTVVSENLKDYKAINPKHIPYDIDGEGNITTHINRQVVAYIIEDVPAVNGADGYVKYECKKCHEVVTYVVKAKSGITFYASVDEKADSYTGTTIAVNVAVSAVNYEFNTIKFDIATGAGLIANKDVKVNYTFPEGDFVNVRVTPNDGFATVLLYVSNDSTTKEAKNTVINGEKVDLVTVYFTVESYASKATVTGLEITELYNAVTKEDAVKVEAEEDVKSFATDLKGVEKFATTIIGDYTADGNLDAADSNEIMKAILTGESVAILDLDKDGDVDLDDHVRFLNYYTSDKNYADFLTLVGIDYMEAIANYPLRNDLNGDRVIDELDNAVIALYLEERMEVIYPELQPGSMISLDDLIGSVIFDIVGNGIIG